ncbi:putative fatty acyl-CoA reductase CG5065 [Zeugodacus cucurbitae]|uniref:putative fatty acyl-CoA reductase CG5065 n=1 Tax=Zeugodacus cucurbitae TaxID=28588 RepID=UPI0005969851|nr:putative fatty acyl-CoA reductase CG5065 [Zeugodacus cucurbitae]XP_054087548.1 putative fatty acyl-CoA reductase CG5065 [Zeugodacus cucurbitae]
MLISQFFENQEIFITGGSGFIGKGLIEKILRSCPNVGAVYVLLRPKKGKNIEDRLNDILNSQLFERLRQEQPQNLKKVHAIAGDCSELGLGISEFDLIRLKNVNIIYHSAASVRFDDPLRDAILMNTRGTYELIKIAENLKHLKVFIHVSTTYCYPNRRVVGEQFYPSYADWRTTIKLAETYNTEMLNVFNLKYGDFQPNTYTFTKSLAEQIIKEYKDRLPLVIFRPSIVVSSIIDPVPGWVDNFNGPIGMLVACGIGIFRTSYGEPNIISDFVPVDIVVRAMLIATYRKGNENRDKDASKLEVVNCAASKICPITTGEVIEIGKKVIKETPFEKTLWVPDGSITRCPVWNFIRFFTLQILVAIFADFALRFTNTKPFLLKLQRRIYAATLALHYFVTTEWDFKNDNFYELNSFVPESEVDKFGFLQYRDLDYEQFFRKGIRGARVFLLNEPPTCSQGALTRMKIYKALHFLFKLIGSVLILRFVANFIYYKFFTTVI